MCARNILGLMGPVSWNNCKHTWRFLPALSPILNYSECPRPLILIFKTIHGNSARPIFKNETMRGKRVPVRLKIG